MQDKFIFRQFGVDYCFDRSHNSRISIYEPFLHTFAAGTWEQNTFDIFNHVKDPSRNALDIGAWIGPTTIWLAKHFKEVLAIDADAVAVEALKSNLIASRCANVRILDKPIHAVETNVTFGVNQFVPDFQAAGLGTSTSQIKTEGFTATDYQSRTITLPQIDRLFPFQDIAFVKIDIEGGEENILADVISAAENFHWKLWISFHLDWWRDKNIERFHGIFNQAKIVMFDQLGQNISAGDVIPLITKYPFSSVYFEY